MRVTTRGSVVMAGRSDATLNRHGVRMGSADIYAVVDKLPQVSESLVIGAELGDGGYWMVLFVVLTDGTALTEELTRSIRAGIRIGASPRHVPDDIIELAALPHTRTGRSSRFRSNGSSRASPSTRWPAQTQSTISGCSPSSPRTSQAHQSTSTS